MNRLSAPLTGAFGLVLLLSAHAYGWPVVEGGSVAISDVLVAELERSGGTVTTGQWVTSLRDLPPATAVLLDTSPKGLLDLAGNELPPAYARSLRRFRYGPGVFKLDWELSGPVPWAAEECRRAGTVHVGGTFAEVAASEAAPMLADSTPSVPSASSCNPVSPIPPGPQPDDTPSGAIAMSPQGPPMT